AMDVGVAVAVGDIDLAVDGLRRGGGMVEGRAERGPMALAQGLRDIAGVIEAQDLMGVAVDHQDRAVRGGIDGVRLRERAFAPAAQEGAVALEHQDGAVGAALGDVHAALAIDHQVGDEAEALARGQARPLAMDGVAAVAQDHGVAFVGHGGPLSCGWPTTAGPVPGGWSQGPAAPPPGAGILGTTLPPKSNSL